MAENQTIRPIILDIGTLNEISARLFDRAEQITQITLADLAMDLRLAARCCDHLAHIRFIISEIADKTSDPATAQDLRDLRTDVEF